MIDSREKRRVRLWMRGGRVSAQARRPTVLDVVLAGALAPLAGPVRPQVARRAPSVVEVAQQTVDPVVVRNARVEAIEAVDVRPRLQGFIEEVAFEPGAYVERGDLLVTIESAR